MVSATECANSAYRALEPVATAETTFTMATRPLPISAAQTIRVALTPCRALTTVAAAGAASGRGAVRVLRGGSSLTLGRLRRSIWAPPRRTPRSVGYVPSGRPTVAEGPGAALSRAAARPRRRRPEQIPDTTSSTWSGANPCARAAARAAPAPAGASRSLTAPHVRQIRWWWSSGAGVPRRRTGRRRPRAAPAPAPRRAPGSRRPSAATGPEAGPRPRPGGPPP